MSDKLPAEKIQISIRVDRDVLDALKRMGEAAQPVPAKLNAMIGAALKEYVERHGERKGKR